jgi:MFS family permease
VGSQVARHERGRRKARLTGACGLLLAIALPWVLFHRVITVIASEFRLDARYLVQEFSPWLLIGIGIAFLLPVVASAGRDPDGRFYPRARGAYFGWGVTLYLLGLALASQVAQLMHLTGSA